MTGLDGTETDDREQAAPARSVTAEDFLDWLHAAGYSRRTAAGHRAFLNALVARWPGALEAAATGLHLAREYEEAMTGLSERQAAGIRGLPRLLGMMNDDRKEMATNRGFHFYQINPGISGMGFGAERAGGRTVGAELVSPKAKAAYGSFHGSDSIGEPESAPDLVLANIPFSAFASLGNGDPETEEILKAAAKRAKTAQAALFRVEWTTGERMGLDASGHAALVAKHMPGFEVRHLTVSNEHFVPMRGTELFIGASMEWTSEFRIVASDPSRQVAETIVSGSDHTGWAAVDPRIKSTRFPGSPAERIDADYLRDPRAAIVDTDKGPRMLFPLEIMSLLGFPAHFNVPWDTDTSYHLLGESVAVPVAERAVRSLLRAVGLE